MIQIRKNIPGKEAAGGRPQKNEPALACRIEKLWHRREKKSRQADCVIFYEKFMEFLLYFCRKKSRIGQRN